MREERARARTRGSAPSAPDRRRGPRRSRRSGRACSRARGTRREGRCARRRSARCRARARAACSRARRPPRRARRARGRRCARRPSGCACAASPTSPSCRPRTAPRPRAPRCARGGGSRSRTGRARSRRSRAPTAARRAGRVRSPASRPGRARARGARRRCARPRDRSRRRCRPFRRAGRRDTSSSARSRRVRARGRARTPSPRASSRTSSARRGCRASGRCRPCAGAPRRVARRRRARARCPASISVAGVADLQRERRVDDVGRRQPVVHPAALGAELLGDGVDERGEIVVGRLLDLGDALGGRRDRAARGSRRRRRRGTAPTSAQPSSAASSTSSQRCELALLRPDPCSSPGGSSGRSPGQCRAGPGGRLDAGGSSARMRAASTAAFFALSTPTVATGTPGGIWTIESSASSPSSTDIDERSGTPITGSSVCAATTPGQRGGEPGAADQHLQARAPRRAFAYSATASGVRCAERTSNSQRDRRGRRARRAPPACAHDRTPSRPGSRRAAQASCHRRDVAPELDALEGHAARPPRRRARARRATVAPVPVTERILPPFVTTRPSRAAVPPWKTSAPAASACVEARRSRCRRSRCGPGSRAPARTTVTAASLERAERDRRERSPRAAAASASSRSPSSRGISTCVSGSPKRALNSSTLGPSAVSIRPANRQPTNGAPRRASSSITGWWMRSTRPSRVVEPRHRRVGAHPAGVRPGVAVADPLEVLRRAERDDAGGRRRARTARPRRPRAAPRSRRRRRTPCTARSASSSSSAVRQTKTPLPDGEPVGLDDARRARDGQRRGRRHAGRPQHLLRERLRPFDPRGRGARAEDGDAVRGAARRRRPRRVAPSGPITTRSVAERHREAEQPVAVVGAHRVAAAERRDAGVAGRGVQLGQAAGSARAARRARARALPIRRRALSRRRVYSRRFPGKTPPSHASHFRHLWSDHRTCLERSVVELRRRRSGTWNRSWAPSPRGGSRRTCDTLLATGRVARATAHGARRGGGRSAFGLGGRRRVAGSAARPGRCARRAGRPTQARSARCTGTKIESATITCVHVLAV